MYCVTILTMLTFFFLLFRLHRMCVLNQNIFIARCQVYLITPTYARYTQKVDLYRMCYTLRLVPNVIWIIVEDAEEKTDLVRILYALSFRCNSLNGIVFNGVAPQCIANDRLAMFVCVKRFGIIMI